MCSWKTRDPAGGARVVDCSGGVGAGSASAPRAGRARPQGTRWWGRCPCLWGPAGRVQAMGPALPLFCLAVVACGISVPRPGVELGSQQ